MRFLIGANLPRSTAALLSRFGHETVDVRDIGLAAASDDVIARYGRMKGLALVTRDFDFADIRNYPPADYGSIWCWSFPKTRSLPTSSTCWRRSFQSLIF